MNKIKTMIIRHCIKCDATMEGGNHFQEWLVILQAGSKVRVSEEVPHLDVEYVQEGLNCGTCLKNEIGETVTMVVFRIQDGE